MDQYEEYALKTVSNQDIRFVQLWFIDLDGNLLVQSISPLLLQSAFLEGVTFPSNSLLGKCYKSTDNANELLLKPDAATFQILPWRNFNSNKIDNSNENDETNSFVARIFCNIIDFNAKKSPFDCRNILKEASKLLADQNLSLVFKPEIEFYLLKSQPSSKNINPIDHGEYYSHITASESRDFRRDIIILLDKIGINIEYSNHESGFGQNRIIFSNDDLLEMCDNIITIRTVIREIANQNGLYASFMPKIAANYPSSGLCTIFHLANENSLEIDQNNGFEGSVEQFIQNSVQNIPDLMPLFANHINSFKRLLIDVNTPKNYELNNKMSNIYRKVGQNSISINYEFRLPGSDSNPYLAFAAFVISGVNNDNQSFKSKIDCNFERVLEDFKNSEFVNKYFEAEFIDAYYNMKCQELDQYLNQITDFEYEN